MPLPLVLGIGAGIAAAGGLGTGIHGGVKMKRANDTMKSATEKRNQAVADFEAKNEQTSKVMDDFGIKELTICSQFQNFAELIDLIQNKPKFKEYDKENINIPKYDSEELKKVSVGASVILGGAGGATLGTIGGLAASGAAYGAVMTLGTASTGTAIASLSGVAATNATLAALGGGSIAAGGGGMALGTTMLGVSTAGVGILIGGVIFDVVGHKLSSKADDAYYQALEIEREVKEIVDYLDSLENTTKNYQKLLNTVWTKYKKEYKELEEILVDKRKLDWTLFTDEEKMITQNCILLVGLLYKMCKVSLVAKTTDEKGNEKNVVNIDEVDSCVNDVNTALDKIA